jgi:hypothetical protein
MRIINGKHGQRDYYDGVQAMFAHERDIVYIRNEQMEVPPEEQNNSPFGISFDSFHLSNQLGKSLYQELGAVHFCGKCYPFIRLYFRDTTWNKFPGDTFVYTAEEWEEFRANNQAHIGNHSSSFLNKGDEAVRKNHLERTPDRDAESEKLCVERGSPIIIERRKRIKIINGCLKDVQFFKVFDTYRCFQEIRMYIGGVLGNANPKIPDISNTDMLEAKGFDKKTSFRKPPSKERK